MLDLDGIDSGFADGATDSQSVFRQGLAALSRPGTVLECGARTQSPAGVQPAAIALMLALLDQDTTLWLSTGFSGAVAGHLRFHTGCALVGEPRLAGFALVASSAELPALDAFDPGSAEYPDRSTTIVLQVEGLGEQGDWRLSGPGIRGEAMLSVAGLGGGFVTQWRRNHKRFPQGVDVLFACGTKLCGLPRTTRIEA